MEERRYSNTLPCQFVSFLFLSFKKNFFCSNSFCLFEILGLSCVFNFVKLRCSNTRRFFISRLELFKKFVQQTEFILLLLRTFQVKFSFWNQIKLNVFTSPDFRSNAKNVNVLPLVNHSELVHTYLRDQRHPQYFFTLMIKYFKLEK